jgi:hypothetical protein
LNLVSSLGEAVQRHLFTDGLLATLKLAGHW